MAKSILCPNPNCGRTFAKLLGDRTLDLRRQKQQIIITGKDCQIIATCGLCNEKNVLFIEDGKLNEESVTFRDVLIDKPDDQLSEEQQKEKEEELEEQKRQEEEALKGNKPEDDETPPTE